MVRTTVNTVLLAALLILMQGIGTNTAAVKVIATTANGENLKREYPRSADISTDSTPVHVPTKTLSTLPGNTAVTKDAQTTLQLKTNGENSETEQPVSINSLAILIGSTLGSISTVIVIIAGIYGLYRKCRDKGTSTDSGGNVQIVNYIRFPFHHQQNAPINNVNAAETESDANEGANAIDGPTRQTPSQQDHVSVTCEICGSVFKNKHGLDTHKGMKHKDKGTLEQHSNDDRRNKQNDTGTGNKNGANGIDNPTRQTPSQQDQVAVTCEICGQVCKNEHGLNIHKGKMHKDSQNKGSLKQHSNDERGNKQNVSVNENASPNRSPMDAKEGANGINGPTVTVTGQKTPQHEQGGEICSIQNPPEKHSTINTFPTPVKTRYGRESRPPDWYSPSIKKPPRRKLNMSPQAAKSVASETDANNGASGNETPVKTHSGQECKPPDWYSP